MSQGILHDIIGDFELEKFIRFFRDKNKSFTPQEEEFDVNDELHLKNGRVLGEIIFHKDERLSVFAFETDKHLSEKSGKKVQYEKGRNILKERQLDAGIFIFYDATGNFRFSLIYPQYFGKKRSWNNFRRYTYFVTKESNNKTFLQQIGRGSFSSLNEIKESFSLAQVTKDFYNDFYPLFQKVAQTVSATGSTNISVREKENFALLFVIRIIFLGFIQKRGWLGDDQKFLQKYLEEYESSSSKIDSFHSRWLEPLFFEALNSPYGRKVAYQNNEFSAETESKLQMAPYLNGGLFQRKDIDNQGFYIPDKLIKDFFTFLFSYNFTIEENTLYDEELELNPEFLGIIFERLVNKADGAVYTPRTEVDLMCRLSLVKWLAKNNTTDINIRDLYELFFIEGGLSDEYSDQQKYGSFSKKQYQDILDLFDKITICDPAVGSGAFPVGMLQIIDEIEDHINQCVGDKHNNAFDRKKRIIGKSLYGVEVKEWAVWITQLRLWITLFIDAPDEMKQSLEPILPSLDFKMRQGDSLVQMVGDKMFPVSGHAFISSKIKRKVTELKNLKVDYYYNKKDSFKKWEIEQKELQIYRDILDDEIGNINSKLDELRNIKKSVQSTLPTREFAEKKEAIPQKLFSEDQKKIKEFENKKNELEEQKKSLRKDKPLIWSIEFAEIFVENDGFDLVIGNPPYVRQEDISDPTSKVKNKKDYKNLLQEMIKIDFPDYFSSNSKINAQSDLYTYFYIRALRLLNPQGIHTFICSNSWLDVGYGVWLQKFLLDRAAIELIIDNQAKRSFGEADINTIISIINAPSKKVKQNHLIKFTAIKRPFEEVVFTENLLLLETSKQVTKNDVLRVYPISIHDLKEAGTEYESEQQKKLDSGKYIGEKWGSKFLNSPDLIFNIFINPKKLIVRLNTIYNFTQRNNLEVFKNKEKKLKSPKVFPYLSSIKDVQKIKVLSKDLKYGLSVSKDEIDKMLIPDIISNRFISDRLFYLEGDKFAVSDTFFILTLENKFNKEIICALLNSTFSLLLTEIIGRKNLGGGLLTFYGYELSKMYIVNPELIVGREKIISNKYNKIANRKINNIFIECGIDPKLDIPIERQEPKPLLDRAGLDNIIFDAIGLTSNERKDVYRGVCRLVWNRISKAKSVK
ncbi:MAG: Eco57I restriction-modification methylase domain-containing protein [bacterium]|nr:Eco57I restriction-modification methylase domain-containing protein [bacterium]